MPCVRSVIKCYCIIGDKQPQEVEIRTITTIVEEHEIEHQIPVEMLSKLKLEDLSKEQVANLTFADYLEMYVPYTRKGKKQIEDTTYSSYVNNIKSPVGPYFRETGIALKDLTARDIQDFYDVQLERVTANTVIWLSRIPPARNTPTQPTSLLKS